MTAKSRPLRFWLITLAAVLGMAVTASLGRWQLDRAAQKEALHAAIEAEKTKPPIGAQALAGLKDYAGLVYHPIKLEGRWDVDHTVYLDNRQMHARPGFYVVTPLILSHGNGVALVQRGWIPRDFIDRNRLAPVQTPEGDVAVTGHVAPAPSHLFEFSHDADKAGAGEGSSRIRQNLDLAAYRVETRLDFPDGSIVQTGGPSEGLLRDWPEVNTGVEKHYGYAFQWFGLCALMAFLYVWFQFIAPRRKLRRG